MARPNKYSKYKTKTKQKNTSMAQWLEWYTHTENM